MWKVSSSIWTGVISATLHGSDVEQFLDAMDSGDEETAIGVLADAYDTGGFDFAQRLDLGGSDWGAISYED